MISSLINGNSSVKSLNFKQLFSLDFCQSLSLTVSDKTWNGHWNSAASPPLYTNTHFFLCGCKKSKKKSGTKTSCTSNFIQSASRVPSGWRGLWHRTNWAQRLTAGVSSNDASMGLMGQEARFSAKTNFAHIQSALCVSRGRRGRRGKEGGGHTQQKNRV